MLLCVCYGQGAPESQISTAATLGDPTLYEGLALMVRTTRSASLAGPNGSSGSAPSANGVTVTVAEAPDSVTLTVVGLTTNTPAPLRL